jgi:hypothetical protein
LPQVFYKGPQSVCGLSVKEFLLSDEIFVRGNNLKVLGAESNDVEVEVELS